MVSLRDRLRYKGLGRLYGYKTGGVQVYLIDVDKHRPDYKGIVTVAGSRLTLYDIVLEVEGELPGYDFGGGACRSCIKLERYSLLQI